MKRIAILILLAAFQLSAQTPREHHGRDAARLRLRAASPQRELEQPPGLQPVSLRQARPGALPDPPLDEGAPEQGHRFQRRSEPGDQRDYQARPSVPVRRGRLRNRLHRLQEALRERTLPSRGTAEHHEERRFPDLRRQPRGRLAVHLLQRRGARLHLEEIQARADRDLQPAHGPLPAPRPRPLEAAAGLERAGARRLLHGQQPEEHRRRGLLLLQEGRRGTCGRRRIRSSSRTGTSARPAAAWSRSSRRAGA